MAILFHNKDVDFELDKPVKTRSWVKKIIQGEKKTAGDINFVFTSDEDLLKVNRQFLKHDTYTDIITFDYSEGKKLNADIMISLDRVEENAKKLKVTFKEELRRVMIHGVLHLCGYKDKTAKDKVVMRKKEDAALARFQKS
jgi:probable rRNA maturation factor